MSRGLAAEHALWNGDPAAALEHLDAAMATLSAVDAGTLRLVSTALWALAELGRTDGADDLIARARHAATSGPDGDRAGLGLEGRAWALRAEAEWHRVHGRLDADLYRQVAEAFDYGFVYEAARARWRLAEALLSAGEREAALAAYEQAHKVATDLKATPFLRALDDLGRRARFTSSAGDGALTPREVEVLALVTDGLTNREIAERLYIAQKTVSVHVSNILGKLDVSTRTQAAAAARRDGLLPS